MSRAESSHERELVSLDRKYRAAWIDVVQGAVLLAGCRRPAQVVSCHPSGLALPPALELAESTWNRASALQDSTVIESVTALPRLLRRLSDEHMAPSAPFVFGVHDDGLHPFEEKFDSVSRSLELICDETSRSVILQTRSSLVVLLLPLLKRLGARVTIVMAIETLHDPIHQRFFAHLPRPSERVKAARALRTFGIPVAIQLAPFFPQVPLTQDLKTMAESIGELSDTVFLRSFDDIVPAVSLGKNRTTGQPNSTGSHAFLRLHRFLSATGSTVVLGGETSAAAGQSRVA